jgi:hypothetical protein
MTASPGSETGNSPPCLAPTVFIIPRGQSERGDGGQTSIVTISRVLVVRGPNPALACLKTYNAY